MSKTAVNENPTDSPLVAHAIRELDLIEVNDEMRDWLLGVIRMVSTQGHSGGSASWFIPVLYDLLQFKPLSPITDNPQDWVAVAEGVWQCVRDSECFSADGGKTYKRLGEDEGVAYVAQVSS